MIAATVEQVTKEMKAHPFTLIAVLALIAYAVYSSATFASDSAVKDLGDKVDRVLVLQIGESIRTLSEQVCDATGQNRRILLQTIDDLQQDYEEITEHRYPAQPCR